MAAANADPSLIVVTQLVGATSGSTTLASGTNLFAGPVRPHGSGIPLGPIVFCLATGGPPGSSYLGTNKDLRAKRVQVRVRSSPGDFAGGSSLATAAMTRVHKSTPASWVDLFVVEAFPTYLAQDANDCHEWSFNVDCRIVEATA